MFALLVSCNSSKYYPTINQLYTNQKAIIACVEVVTNKASLDYITIVGRVATFDNGGNL